MQRSAIYPRHAEALLTEALADSPVTLIHGSRQCGKATFAREIGIPRGYTNISFDDDNARRTVRSDPVGFVEDLPEHAILDEVQRVTDLFTALEVVVDRDRVPGRFILTGSTNILLLPRLSDSLAGRMQTVRLYRFSQCEIVPGTSADFIPTLFAGGFKTRRTERLAGRLAERIVAGAYPAALKRPAGRRRAAWYLDFIENLIQRDVRNLARIRSLETVPRLIAAVATHTASLFNLASLAAPFQVSKNTVREYFTLLERLFLVD
ncbi:MAG: AAA family ATPase, partial [Bryobacterales bacterium]|nr:AAA family ATPase [Bryobacterales bacterium]